jgi:hypothetical protein
MDEAIAAALDTSVLWLVYGYEQFRDAHPIPEFIGLQANEPKIAYEASPPNEVELRIMDAICRLDEDARQILMAMVESISPILAGEKSPRRPAQRAGKSGSKDARGGSAGTGAPKTGPKNMPKREAQ